MPEIAIDRTLSIYNMLGRLNVSQHTVIRRRPIMNAISYEIENLVIRDGVRGRIFASFQRMSRFVPQITRYRQIASRAESVYVIGVMDIVPPPIPNITYIPLPPDAQLVKEWFVILDSPVIASTLATLEVNDLDAPDEERRFRGVWTLNPEMTNLLQEWLSSLVNARTLTFLDLPNETQKSKLVSQMQRRLQARVARESERSAQVAEELQREIDMTFVVDRLP